MLQYPYPGYKPPEEPNQSPINLKLIVVVIGAAIAAIVVVYVIVFILLKPPPAPIVQEFMAGLVKQPDETPAISLKAFGFNRSSLNAFAYRPDGSFIQLYILQSPQWEIKIPVQEYGSYLIRVEDQNKNVLYNQSFNFTGNITLTIRETKGLKFMKTKDEKYYLGGESIIIIRNDGNVPFNPVKLTITFDGKKFSSQLEGRRWLWPGNTESYRVSRSSEINASAGTHLGTISIFNSVGDTLQEEEIEFLLE